MDKIADDVGNITPHRFQISFCNSLTPQIIIKSKKKKCTKSKDFTLCFSARNNNNEILSTMNFRENYC